MKPLVILIATFLLVLLITALTSAGINPSLAGRVGMSAMLLFTALGHFMFTKGMTMMIPQAVPFKTSLVRITGILEILAAIGLLIPSLYQFTGHFLILFFLLLLPANVYAAIKKVDYQKGDFTGKGLKYLWFRIPLQLFFITWTWYFCL
ncbi:hypothetical protein [Solitalea lacus]|uniref:DoxX family protein n=1 Tax=Solitalea lacus TaxID=2911172 RepID=UPI001EDA2C1E|nr:hypothetical protein [Solitalea lacus]UKJ09104.1 hypothetical protein L2B55_08035 [Solitalea lacus]